MTAFSNVRNSHEGGPNESSMHEKPEFEKMTNND
jgi:hypothetical protein